MKSKETRSKLFLLLAVILQTRSARVTDCIVVLAKNSKDWLSIYIYRDSSSMPAYHIAATPPLRHAIALHLRYAKSRGKWQR